MIAKILILLAILIAVFLIIAAFQPDTYRVSRSISIAAPASVPFAYVNDLHKWQEMSPYVKLDTAAKYTFAGPEAGPGASLAWAGNSKVGEGKMTIVESRPTDLVRMQLDFIKPFPSSATIEFTFKPEAGQTLATWAMTGKKNFMSKAVCMVMNMDKMVGKDFEAGLASLKQLSETRPNR